MNNKKIINEVMKNHINNNIINSINNNKLSYLNHIKIYNHINEELNKKNIYSYDIDNYINSNNDFKKFVISKNKNIFLKAYNTSNWKQNINNLYEINDKKLSKVLIEKNYINLFKTKYIFKWDGYWTSIKINKSGTISEINTFDTDDLNFIFNLDN